MPIIDPRGFNLVPDVGGFADSIGAAINQSLSERLAQKAMTGDKEAMAELAVRNPAASGRIGGIMQDQQTQELERRKAYQDMAYRVARGYKTAKDKAGYLSAAAQQLRAAGLEDMAVEIEDDAAVYASNPGQVDQEYDSINEMFSPASAEDAATRNFQFMTQGMSPEDIEKARKVELGILPRAGISASERIASTPGMAETVAASEAAIEGAKSGAAEGAKLGQQAARLPDLRAAIKTAEAAAAAKGESMTDLKRAQAALPGLQQTVGQLRELARVATSTVAGSIFDTASKELGFGATKGATAKAKFIAIVNNQVLPLLKQTFGGSFTAKEGEALQATMGDPNASEEEKIAQLDAFIQQKVRDIETKKSEAGIPGGGNIDDLVNKYAD